jgi:hypothetical protein
MTQDFVLLMALYKFAGDIAVAFDGAFMSMSSDSAHLSVVVNPPKPVYSSNPYSLTSLSPAVRPMM